MQHLKIWITFGHSGALITEFLLTTKAHLCFWHFSNCQSREITLWMSGVPPNAVVGILPNCISATAQAMAGLSLSASKPRIGGPFKTHGFLRYAVELLVVCDDESGSLDLGERSKRYRLLDFSEEAGKRILTFVSEKLNAFLRRLFKDPPKTCEAWQVLAFELASVFQTTGVPLLTGGLKYDASDGYDDGYAVQWTIRTLFTAACRHRSIMRLRLLKTTPWQMLPGPDHYGYDRSAGRASKCTTALDMLRKIGYSGPAELCKMRMCLLSSPRYASSSTFTSASDELAVKKRPASAVVGTQCQYVYNDCWALPCKHCSNRICYGSKEAASSCEPRYCKTCAKRVRPEVGSSAVHIKASAADVRRSRPETREHAANRIELLARCAKLLKCETCRMQTLQYGKDADRTFPRWCGVCKKKKRPLCRLAG